MMTEREALDLARLILVWQSLPPAEQRAFVHNLERLAAKQRKRAERGVELTERDAGRAFL